MGPRWVGDQIEWGENYHGTLGSLHFVSADHDEDDVVRRLHEVVQEVTGKPVDQPQKRRIGFTDDDA